MKKIPLTITTCKRPDLFEKTIETLFFFCNDSDLINKILVVDDNSTDNDLKRIEKILFNTKKEFEIIRKNNNQKGHSESLNIIRDKILDDIVFCCEDDWEFTNNFNIQPYIEIIKNDLSISEIVLINAGGLRNKRNIIYNDFLFERVYVSDDPYPNWPPFTLNPSIQNFKILKEKVGYFKKIKNFELEYAKRCHEANLRLLYHRWGVVKHIGNISSYKLNNEIQ